MEREGGLILLDPALQIPLNPHPNCGTEVEFDRITFVLLFRWRHTPRGPSNKRTLSVSSSKETLSADIR